MYAKREQNQFYEGILRLLLGPSLQLILAHHVSKQRGVRAKFPPYLKSSSLAQSPQHTDIMPQRRVNPRMYT